MKNRHFSLITLVLGALTIMSQPSKPAAKKFSPGLKVGDKIPAFTIKDHTGKTRNFNSLAGPKGLIMVFYRSADW